jgi:hypothetical protein
MVGIGVGWIVGILKDSFGGEAASDGAERRAVRAQSADPRRVSRSYIAASNAAGEEA